MKIVYIVAVNHPNQHKKKKKGEKRKIKLTKDTQTVFKKSLLFSIPSWRM